MAKATKSSIGAGVSSSLANSRSMHVFSKMKPLNLAEFNKSRGNPEKYDVPRRDPTKDYDRMSDYARKGQTSSVSYADERIQPKTLDSSLRTVSFNYMAPSHSYMPMANGYANTMSNSSTVYSTNQQTDYSIL